MHRGTFSTVVPFGPDHLHQREEALVLRAPVDGTWISPAVNDFVGLWMKRGVPLGHIVQDKFPALPSYGNI